MKKLLVSTLFVAGLAGVLPGQTYNISTVAGSTSAGLGDNSAAGLATLVRPVDAVADAAGNIYISDSDSFVQLPASAPAAGTAPTSPLNAGGRIRKIDGKTGIITTLMFSATNFEPDYAPFGSTSDISSSSTSHSSFRTPRS